MSAFEAEIRNSLAMLASQVNALTNGMDNLQKKGKKAGDDIKDKFNEAAAAAKKAAEQQKQFDTTIQKVGSGLNKFGGPLGDLIGKLTGGAGMGGALATVATAAALAGFAMKAFNAVVDAQIDRVRRLSAAQRELITIKENARKTEQQQGTEGLSQGERLRTLFNRGGEDAAIEANTIALQGFTTTEEAQSGIAQAFLTKDKKTRDLIIKAATQVTRAGEGGFSDAIKTIQDDPVLLRRIQKGDVGDVSARVVAKNRNQLPSAGNLNNIRNQLERGTFGQAESRFIQQLETTQGLRNDVRIVEQDRVIDGSALSAAREDLARAKSPETAAILELFKKQQQADADMREQAKAQTTILGRIHSTLQNIGALVGGPGDIENQRRRQVIAESNAALGTR